ncbi:L-threonylcarbamoyladenylate synthase [Zhihengliuella sp.]|uniref:L-threonylcarbamoyladenylate synthase n=1 Tax=Zhihengliuella sp. TaxID=1954483 RepID=UPI002811F110|nr:L-threonylcarbamoyladenylate synthase [Zhihengliuella sp.]
MHLVTSRFDCQDAADRTAGLDAAREALAARQCVVLPTDTVYGIAADAFSPQAVATLLAAKGRGRTMPPPVLIPRPETLDGLATEVPDAARKLAAEFWPGALTMILNAQPSLTWDLGETKGTVALRMPDDDVALELLRAVGPLAVSSANRSGNAAATNIDAAEDQLGEAVAVYLGDGERRQGEQDALPSTIVDFTGDVPAVVRQGAIALDDLRRVVPEILGLGEQPAGTEERGSALDAAGSAVTDHPEASASDSGSAGTGAGPGVTDPSETTER